MKGSILAFISITFNIVHSFNSLLAHTSAVTSPSFLVSILRHVPPAQAKGEFYFFFFGGSGALGIGFAQLPKLLEEYKLVQNLGKDQTSLGGDNFACNPLATIGYPTSLKLKDVDYMIESLPSMETVQKKGQKKSYMANLGYLEKDAFFQCLQKCNKLVLYTAFNALAGGSSDLASPLDYEVITKRWKDKESGLDAFKSDILSANLKKYSAYIIFFFLIGLVLDLIIESGINAFLE